MKKGKTLNSDEDYWHRKANTYVKMIFNAYDRITQVVYDLWSLRDDLKEKNLSKEEVISRLNKISKR